MVSKFFKFLNRDISTINQAALLLGIFSLLSQVFGLLRDRLLASLVGPSATLDVYYAAFRIPDFIYVSIASLFAVTVIIPFITKYLAGEDTQQRLQHFSNTIFTIYCIGMVVVCTAVYFLMPNLVHLIAPGFSGAQEAQLILFSRVMLLSPFLMGLSSLLGAFAQVQKKFFSFALAPLFYNLGILVGVIGLLPLFGMFGVVLGVIIGAVLHLLIQLPTLLSISGLPKLVRTIDFALVREVVSVSLPRTLALSLTNITMIIMSASASLLAVGSISVFQLAYNIETAPLMIIGVSYAVASFPAMTRLFVENKKREFVDIVHRAVRTILFFSIPASVLFIVLRAQIVRVLLGAGNFSWSDTRLVAASLALFSLSITAQCLVLLFVRGFYAMNNTKTPLFINLLSVVVTGLSLVWLLFFYSEYPMFRLFLESLLRVEGVGGASVVLLPLAFSIGQVFNAVMLWFLFYSKNNEHVIETRSILQTAFHSLGAAIISGAAAYITLYFLGIVLDQTQFFGVLLQGVIAGIVGIGIYAIFLIALKNEDIVIFGQTLRSKFWRQKPITPEKPTL